MESEAAALDEAELDAIHSLEIKSYLTEKVKQFQASCIKNPFREWASYTMDKENLGSVAGLSLEFSDNQLLHYHSRMEMRFSFKEELFLEDETKNLLQKGVMKESQHEKGEFICPIFLVPKYESFLRMILNLKKLNENMPYLHFKMETIKSISILVTPNYFMTKVDIKDAHYSVPIPPEHQKYVKFYFRGKLCQFTCLPNGLCSDPRKFTNLLKPPLSYLRLQVTVARVIDDLITLGRSFAEFEGNIKLLLTLLDSLGFVVHPNKSIFIPARSIEYLDFVIDSQSVNISLTQKKKACIKQLCHEVLQEEFLITRKIARLLGKFTSSFPAVRFVPFNYRSLERDKILTLKFVKGNFDKKMKVSQAGKMGILRYVNNIEDSFSPIKIPNCTFY